MSKIQAKIKIIMDEIQELMESHPRAHLEEGSNIHALMASAGLYFQHMDDENKDYYQFVSMAIEEEAEWNV
jgi:hypothetical protein